jgi:aryl-alcohol dehydrogenase-like predicted oxidoreductase
MQKLILGRSGLAVTRVGLGLAALGSPGYINLGHAWDLEHTYAVESMQRHAHAVLDAAWEAGIRYFDAARSYGKAEAFLGSWLHQRGIAPDEVTVGSKWGYVYTADWQVEAAVHEMKQHRLEVLRRQRQEIDALLGPYLRLYQIQSATLESGVLDNPEVLAELARSRDEGLAIGLTVSGPGQADTLRRALAVHMGGQPLFACVQAAWNLLEPSAGPTLQETHARGMGVIVKEALANGRLTSKNDDPQFAEKRRILEEAARELGTTLDALALAAALAQPWADVVLSGATTCEQFLSNLAALQVPWNEGAGNRLASLAEEREAYWARRSTLPWN